MRKPDWFGWMKEGEIGCKRRMDRPLRDLGHKFSGRQAGPRFASHQSAMRTAASAGVPERQPMMVGLPVKARQAISRIVGATPPEIS